MNLQELIKELFNEFVIDNNLLRRTDNGPCVIIYNANLREGLAHALASKIESIISDQRADETQLSIAELSCKIDELQKSQVETIENQAKVIQQQHDAIVRYENDLLYKTKKDLLMELIGIADQIQYTLDDQKAAKDYDMLLDAVEQLGEWVRGSLSTETVRCYNVGNTDYTDFDSRLQEVIEVRPTDNPAEDNTIKSILPGYTWIMPMVGSMVKPNDDGSPVSISFIMRPEQVVRLRYRKPEGDLLTDNRESINGFDSINNFESMERPQGIEAINNLDNQEKNQNLENLENQENQENLENLENQESPLSQANLDDQEIQATVEDYATREAEASSENIFTIDFKVKDDNDEDGKKDEPTL